MNSKHTAYPKTIDGASRTKSPSNGEGIEEATRADGNGRTSWEPRKSDSGNIRQIQPVPPQVNPYKIAAKLLNFNGVPPEGLSAHFHCKHRNRTAIYALNGKRDRLG